jgi:hypothetical protein
VACSPCCWLPASEQGSNVESFLSQPGLVQTELNARKLDHRKWSAIGVDLATKV